MVRTFKILVKKCLRDIVRNLKQFIAIIFIIAVAVTLFVGLQANSQEFERRVNAVYKEGNVADIWVTVQPDLFNETKMDEEYNKIVEINGGKKELVEKRLYMPTTINNLSAYAITSKDFPKINTGYELELSGNFNLENFFVVDKDFVKRYELMTGETLKLGDTLPVSIDFSSFTNVGSGEGSRSEKILEAFKTQIEESKFLNESFKKSILIYIENNKDSILTQIDEFIDNYLNVGNVEIKLQINGFMKHPENIQSATFNDSCYLISTKLLLKKLVDNIFQKIDLGNESLQTLLKSLQGDIDLAIDNDTNETINMLMNNLNNQFVLKLGENKTLDRVKDEINYFYKDRGNLLALFDINNMPSNAVIQNDIVQSRQLTYAFPIIFFAVAILVVLTTISQLILKERTQIGTLKSLGLTKRGILFYYIAMMSIITTIGTLLGLIVGPILLPIIMNIKYKILYSLPSLQYLFPYVGSLIVLILLIVAVSFLTFLLIKKELNLTPANSMRPAAPHIKLKGQKTIIKNISLMMALRNIKVHFAKSLMVIVGILGCTGLLICGMGIEDTINYGVNTDLNNILASDLQVTYNIGTEKNIANQKLLSLTDNNGRQAISKAEEFSIMHTTASFNNKNINTAIYYFDKSATNFKYEKWDDQGGEGIAINESKADELGLKVGDTINFTVGGVQYNKKIVSIFYTFTVSGLFIYTDTIPELTSSRTNAWVTVNEGFTVEEVKELILNAQIKEVNSALTKTENLAKIDGYMANVKSMTDTIKVFAIVLAVIVLINLSILNFRERLRDYATLKVLGYSRFEISRSMIYETMILTTIGSLFGLLAGFPLEMLVLGTNQTPLLSWKYTIFPQTFIYAFLISFLTALVVNILMSFEIKKISMSESLKSVE